MKIQHFAAATISALLLLLSPRAGMGADIRIIAGGPQRAVFNDLGPQFERDSGHKLNISFGATETVRRQIDEGAAFDVVVTDALTVEGWIKQGKLVASTRTPVAYTGLGLGVRAGAARPNISSAEAARRTLLSLNTLGHFSESASATALRNVLARLGIAEEMKPRLRPMSGAAMNKGVAGGELDAIVGAVPTILVAPGVDLAGAFPPELQTYIPFAAAVSANAKEPEGAQAFIRFLTSPAAASALRTRGMEPGAP